MSIVEMTPEELVGMLKKHDRFVRKQQGGERADLKHQDLSGLKLPGIRLQQATLTGINFSRCVLIGANFSDADLFLRQL